MHPASNRRKLGEIIAFPAIVSVLAIVVSVVLSEVKGKIGWCPIVVTLLCFLLMYVVTLVVVGLQYRPMGIGLLEDLKQSVAGMVDPNHIGIVDNDGLVAIELACKDKE